MNTTKIAASSTGSAVRRALAGATLVAAWCVAGSALDLASPIGSAHAAAEKAKGPQLSKEVSKVLKPAQEALQKQDYDAAIPLAQQGLQLAKTPDDKDISLQFLINAYGGKKDLPNYAATVEQYIELNPPSLTPDQRLKYVQNLAAINFQNNNLAKAREFAAKAIEAGSTAEQPGQIIVASVQKDCQGGAPWLQSWIANREATELQYRVLNACYYQMQDKPKREAVMLALVQKFPKADYFTDYMNLLLEQSPDPKATLAIYRFAFDHGWLRKESEFAELAELALEAGSPSEAQKVAEGATQKGVLTSGDRATRIKSQSKQLAAEDRRTIAAQDKEAKAGKNGEADVKIGLAYLGMGENQKAIDCITRGLQPERVAKVKRVDDAHMMLGIAYLRLGNKTEAQKAFEAAGKDPRMAKASRLWVEVDPQAPAAPAAPAAG